jgi:hypothetical protein
LRPQICPTLIGRADSGGPLCCAKAVAALHSRNFAAQRQRAARGNLEPVRHAVINDPGNLSSLT